MKTATIIFAICATLFSIFMPVSPNPLPAIPLQGRAFNSRFAPPARPVFPRTAFGNDTAVDLEKREPVPGPTAVKRDYPAGPTASALVFRSEHMESPVKQR